MILKHICRPNQLPYIVIRGIFSANDYRPEDNPFPAGRDAARRRQVQLIQSRQHRGEPFYSGHVVTVVRVQCVFHHVQRSFRLVLPLRTIEEILTNNWKLSLANLSVYFFASLIAFSVALKNEFVQIQTNYNCLYTCPLWNRFQCRIMVNFFQGQ